MENGHIQKISQWTEKYGNVIRVSLGEREAVCFPLQCHVREKSDLTWRFAGYHQQSQSPGANGRPAGSRLSVASNLQALSQRLCVIWYLDSWQ